MPGPPRRPSQHRASSSRPRGSAPREVIEELRIEGLAPGGAGVARLSSGAVVFVPGTAAGELVEASVSIAARPARGVVLRVIEPSADRVEPPCSFVASCGGCDWMHLSATAQREAHAEIVHRAIK